MNLVLESDPVNSFYFKFPYSFEYSISLIKSAHRAYTRRTLNKLMDKKKWNKKFVINIDRICCWSNLKY